MWKKYKYNTITTIQVLKYFVKFIWKIYSKIFYLPLYLKKKTALQKYFLTHVILIRMRHLPASQCWCLFNDSEITGNNCFTRKYAHK